MIGERIGGRYVVLDSIGGGGMADVYLALDVILDRHVAVKVLQPQFSKDEQFIKRFRREAQAATSLANPNIVNIYDVGEEDNVYYIVMEYVRGRTLKQVIQEDGPLAIPVALDYFKQILVGVGHAHAMQIVHRDIKPQNILISEDGEAKVTDFGIARAMTSTTITHTNSVMGSVHYLSPEQARGGHVTYRSDLYSLGIVLFEMVTGQIPFSGDTAVSIAIKHLQNDVPSAREIVPSIPQSVENIIKKATQKDPMQRYESAEELILASDSALDPDGRVEEPMNQVSDDTTKEIPVLGEFSDTQDMEDTIAIPAQDVNSDLDRQENLQDTNVNHSERIGNDQNEGETQKGKKPKKSRKKWFWILLIAFGVLLGATILAFTVWSSLFFVEETEVPDVVGQTEEEAIDEIDANNLVAEVEEVASDDFEPGQVTRQDPRGGRVVKEGQTVTIFVAASKEEVSLDDYRTLTLTQAERLLTQRGFTVDSQAREDNSEPPNTVIAQNPSPDSRVIPAETTVVLTYSVPESIQLDDLTNQTEDDVRSYLNQVGLRAGAFTREYDEDVESGRVISQSPEPLTTMEQGDSVEIVLSRGPEPIEEEPEPPQQPEGEAEDPVDADPVEDPTDTDEEEPSVLYQIIQTIVVSEEQQAQGESFDIRIVGQDATSQGDDRVLVEETIIETSDFNVELRVSPSYSGSYEVYINGEFNRQSDVYEYEE
ncbi:Stk1 family PASTA domain-containing Ser/Thr kinase [Shouchella patagoniensis]|uniref:Stk1 family PASTA domain-containing Ser/Thr kinase n=1 Tax=Shouchella patagoniensis TaxID=228576 RepID=UPI000995118E|nr:Stk1 family PASTA domain-containing Ser/Thr kinase [Shouchella patagoniensis]